MGKNVTISTLPNIGQNYLPKINTSNIFANSLVYDDGSSVLINTVTASAYKLDVNGTLRAQGVITANAFATAANSYLQLTYGSDVNSRSWQIQNDVLDFGDICISQSTTRTGSTYSTKFRVKPTGEVALGNGTNNYMLSVDGVGSFSYRVEAASFVPTSTSIPTLGMYTSAANTLNFSTASTNRLTISSTGAATFSSSVTATGQLRTNAAGQSILINPGGTASVRMQLQNGTGNAGVVVESSAGGDQFTGTSAYSMVLGTFGASDLHFGTNSVTRMTVTSGGNVGIGYTSPNYPLQVHSSTSISRIQLTNSSTGTASGDGFQIIADGVNATLSLPETGYMSFETSNAERMRITSGGQVIITGNSNSIVQKASSANGDIFYEWQNSAGTRRGYIGFGGVSSSLLEISNNENAAIDFRTNAAFAMRISSSANINIGYQGDQGSRLYVEGGTNSLYVKGATSTSFGAAITAINSSSTELFLVRNDGFFRTGTAAASPYNFTTANAANCLIDTDGALRRSTSSIKYKTDVKNYDKGLNEVLKLRPVYYKGKNDGNTQFSGLIAEEVHDLGLTEFVQYAEDGSPDALAYQNMVALLTKAIQELKSEIDTLKK